MMRTITSNHKTMEHDMTNDLLTKATALLEARQQATPGKIQVIVSFDDAGKPKWHAIDENDNLDVLTGFESDLAFYALAANTACETIQGYQELLGRMADAIEQLIAGDLDMDELGEAKLLLDEARAALPPTNS
jgi:hypothetical protein